MDSIKNIYFVNKTKTKIYSLKNLIGTNAKNERKVLAFFYQKLL